MLQNIYSFTVERESNRKMHLMFGSNKTLKEKQHMQTVVF